PVGDGAKRTLGDSFVCILRFSDTTFPQHYTAAILFGQFIYSVAQETKCAKRGILLKKRREG
ncbi:MAG TPA: hypothetical protein QGF02_01710, partial [Candidatus Babeliales bacterium]|nr:hypothetical protein [Candidatus Babeliales bacterium]